MPDALSRAGTHDPVVLYFGCAHGVWDRDVGHFFYSEDGRRVGLSSPEALPWKKVDGALAPRVGRSEKPQGVAAIHHKDGWTALSFWDRTGDERGNSSSTFFIEGEAPFEVALGIARERFPRLFARFDRAGLEVVPDA